MARLSFSYPISREYPYRWFPWIVIIGGSVFTVLFSVFSLATKGYYLEVMFTRNPNVTEAELYWFSRPPFSWTDPLSATCQATEIQVGTRVFTDKLWRAFTISKVSIAGDSAPNHEVLEPVLVYKNNPLQNCTLKHMVLHLRNETTLAKQYDILGQGFFDRLEGWGDIICDVKTDPPARLQLSTKISDRIGTWEGESTLSRNFDKVTATMRKRSGVILGEHILTMADQLVKRQQQLLTAGTVNLYPDLAPAIYDLTHDYSDPSLSSITSPNFFFGMKMTPSARGPATGTGSTTQWDDFDYTPLNLVFPDSPPDSPPSTPIPPFIDLVAKVFYSVLLADLGQSNSTVVTSRDLLIKWADELMSQTDEATKSEGPQNWDIVNFWKDVTVDMALPSNDTGLAGSDDIVPAVAGGIGSDWTRSTIYTQYTCQVPKQRVTGSVIIAVFVSDLVLLQALWTVFTWGTMWWMQRGNSSRRDMVMYCQGCVAGLEEGRGASHRCEEQECEGTGGGRLKRWTTNTGRGIKGLGRSLTGLTATEDTSTLKAGQSFGAVFGKGSSSDDSAAVTVVDITSGGKL